MTLRPLRTVRKILTAAAVLATVAALASCGVPEGHSAGQPPTTPPASPGPYGQLDRDATQLVSENATWHAPDHLVVDEVTRIRLAIGSGTALQGEVSSLIAHDVPKSAGTIEIGSTVDATLDADPEDATITPSVAVDASTLSDVQLLWTWLVKPKHPTDMLVLTVHLAIPLSGGHMLTRDLPFTIAVSRTFGYTMRQIGDEWPTLSAVGATVVGVGGWWTARRKQRKRRGVAKSRRPGSAPRAARKPPAQGGSAEPSTPLRADSRPSVRPPAPSDDNEYTE